MKINHEELKYFYSIKIVDYFKFNTYELSNLLQKQGHYSKNNVPVFFKYNDFTIYSLFSAVATSLRGSIF